MVRTEEDEFREFNLLKNSLNKQKEYYEQRIKQIFVKVKLILDDKENSIEHYQSNPCDDELTTLLDDIRNDLIDEEEKYGVKE